MSDFIECIFMVIFYTITCFAGTVIILTVCYSLWSISVSLREIKESIVINKVGNISYLSGQ